MSHIGYAIMSDTVSLQVQLVLGSYGDLVSGEKDITIELRYPLDEIENVVMWSKMYEDIEIVDGY
jgi:hypothetical protein